MNGEEFWSGDLLSGKPLACPAPQMVGVFIGSCGDSRYAWDHQALLVRSIGPIII
jgi:hypothetical protein